jgi:hypothetical protein
MYELIATIDGQDVVLHSLEPDSDRKVLAGGFTDPVSGICVPTAHFTVTPQHPAYDRLHEMTTLVRWVNTITGETEFEGRILRKPKDGMTSDGKISKQFQCEGLSGFLRDSMQMYQIWNGIPAGRFLSFLLDIHNQRCPDKVVLLGRCTMDSTIHAVTSYRSTFEELRVNLIDKLGGEMRVYRDVNGVVRLDYLSSLGNATHTVIELGRGLVSLDHSTDAGSVITRLIPLGKRLGNDTPERLTLKGYYTDDPDRYWVEDADAAALYTDLEGTVTFDEIEEQSELETEAMRYLAEHNRIRHSYRAEVLDLSTIGEDADPLRSGNTYRFRSALTGLDEELRLISRTVDAVNAPYKPTVEIGDRLTKLTERQADLTRTINYTIPQQRYSILDTVQGYISDMMDGGMASNFIFTGHELYVIDTDDVSTANDVWRFNGGGIAHSTNGVDGTYNMAMLADGTLVASFVMAGSVEAQNLTITGGHIHIQADSQNYDLIDLSYTNQSGATWSAEMTPLQFRLTNTDTNYEFRAQSAGLFFSDVTTGATKVSYTPTGIAFYSGGTVKASYAPSSMIFYDTGTSNPLVQVFTATRASTPTGEVEVWNGQSWNNLNDIAGQVDVNKQNIQTLWNAVFHN